MLVCFYNKHFTNFLQNNRTTNLPTFLILILASGGISSGSSSLSWLKAEATLSFGLLESDLDFMEPNFICMLMFFKRLFAPSPILVLGGSSFGWLLSESLLMGERDRDLLPLPNKHWQNLNTY